MADIIGASFAIDREFPESVLHMAEPELAQWAQQKTVSLNSDTSVVRLGAILFWIVVAALLLARVFLVDPARLKPSASTTAATNSAFHLTSNVKP
ncbi:MAG TPA: hypothetical protein VGC86_17350 [Afipia sp.]